MPQTKPLDVKSIAINSLSWVFKVLGQDLEALPEDAFDKHFGPKTRTVADFIQEVMLTQEHIRLIISKQEPFDWPEGWVTAPEDQRSKEAVLKAYRASTEAFLETIRGFTEEQMLEPYEYGGRMTDPFERCRFVVWHAGYHSGQVNYIQTLR